MNLGTEYSRTLRTVILLKCKNVWPIHLINRKYNHVLKNKNQKLKVKERAIIDENIFTEGIKVKAN